MPYENLEQILYSIIHRVRERGREREPMNYTTRFDTENKKLLDSFRGCRDTHRNITNFGEGKFLNSYVPLAYILYWLQKNEPLLYNEVRDPIFNDIPEKFHPLLFDELYSLELQDVDIANLTMEKLAQIKDTRAVGSGNVLIDLVIRNEDFMLDKIPADQAIIAKVIDSIPEMMQKFADVRLFNPYNIQDHQFISPFFPKVPFGIMGMVNFENRGTESKQARVEYRLKDLLLNNQIATEIFARALFERFASVPSNEHFSWQKLVEYNYDAREKKKYTTAELVENIFMRINGDHYIANPDTTIENIKFTLTLARNLYNTCYGTGTHFDYVVALLTSPLHRGHKLYFGEEEIAGNSAFADSLRDKLKLPNNRDGDLAFEQFLEQLSMDYSPSNDVQSPRARNRSQ